MFKSKIFLKAMIIISLLLVSYFFVVSLFILPNVSESLQKLEMGKAKEALSKVTILINSVSNNLKNYKERSMENHKQELKELTQVILTLIKVKYEQSKPENLKDVLKERGEVFKRNLITFYYENRDKMSEEELKKAIINYTKIYRHNSLNTGYFWINDFKANMIMHPMKPELNGKNLWDFKDPKGVYLFRDFAQVCKERGSGIVRYQWENPNNHKVEDKISYVFTFEPFGWAVRKGDPDFLNWLDNFLYQVKNDGRYDKVYRKWMIDSKWLKKVQ